MDESSDSSFGGLDGLSPPRQLPLSPTTPERTASPGALSTAATPTPNRQNESGGVLNNMSAPDFNLSNSITRTPPPPGLQLVQQSRGPSPQQGPSGVHPSQNPSPQHRAAQSDYAASPPQALAIAQALPNRQNESGGVLNNMCAPDFNLSNSITRTPPPPGLQLVQQSRGPSPQQGPSGVQPSQNPSPQYRAAQSDYTASPPQALAIPAGPQSLRTPLPATPAGPQSARTPLPATPAGPQSARTPLPATPAGPQSARTPLPATPARPQSARTPPPPLCEPPPNRLYRSPTTQYSRRIPGYPAQSSPLAQGTPIDQRIRQGERQGRGLSPVTPGPPYQNFEYLDMSYMAPFNRNPTPDGRYEDRFMQFAMNQLEDSQNIPSFLESPEPQPEVIPYFYETPGQMNQRVRYRQWFDNYNNQRQGQQARGPDAANRTLAYDASVNAPSPNSTMFSLPPFICSCCGGPLNDTFSMLSPGGNSMNGPSLNAPAPDMSGGMPLNTPGGMSLSTNAPPNSGGRSVLPPQQSPAGGQQSLNQGSFPQQSSSGGQQSRGPSPQQGPCGGQQSRGPSPQQGPCEGQQSRGSSPQQGPSGVQQSQNPSPQQRAAQTPPPPCARIIRQQSQNQTAETTGYSAIGGVSAPDASQLLRNMGDITDASERSPGPYNGSCCNSSGQINYGFGAARPISLGGSPRGSSGSAEYQRHMTILTNTNRRRSSLSEEERIGIERWLNSHRITAEQLEHLRRSLALRGCRLFIEGGGEVGGPANFIVQQRNGNNSNPQSTNMTFSGLSPLPQGPYNDYDLTTSRLGGAGNESGAREGGGAPWERPEIIPPSPSPYIVSPDNPGFAAPSFTVPQAPTNTAESLVSNGSGVGVAPHPNYGAVSPSPAATGGWDRSASDESSQYLEQRISSRPPPPQGQDAPSPQHSPQSVAGMRPTAGPANIPMEASWNIPNNDARSIQSQEDEYLAQSTPLPERPESRGFFVDDPNMTIMSPQDLSSRNVIQTPPPTAPGSIMTSPEGLNVALIASNNNNAINTVMEPVVHDYLQRELPAVIRELMSQGKWPWRFCDCPRQGPSRLL